MYSDNFRETAVRRLKQGRSASQLAGEMGRVSVATLYHWQRKFCPAARSRRSPPLRLSNDFSYPRPAAEARALFKIATRNGGADRMRSLIAVSSAQRVY